MLDRRIKLFTLFGFPVYIDLSWFFLAALITWSLAMGYFPSTVPGFSTKTYLGLGLLGALGLFLSIVIHECCHSLMARAFKMPMGGITLFLFGGVAELTEEPTDPKSELLIALAGPFSSLILVIVFNVLAAASTAMNGPDTVVSLFQYLALINTILILFNIIPAFPLDGGRVLRSLLWRWKGNMLWATRITANIGKGFGILLMVLGVLSIMGGGFVGGMWWVLIGFFLQNAAGMAYKQTAMNQELAGKSVMQLMKPHPVSVSPNLNLDEFVEAYFYLYHHHSYPVVNDHDQPVGLISISDLKTVPRQAWHQTPIQDVMQPVSEENTISPRQEAVEALNKMSRSQRSKLLVVENGSLVGIITLKDLMDYLSLRMEEMPTFRRLTPST